MIPDDTASEGEGEGAREYGNRQACRGAATTRSPARARVPWLRNKRARRRRVERTRKGGPEGTGGQRKARKGRTRSVRGRTEDAADKFHEGWVLFAEGDLREARISRTRPLDNPWRCRRRGRWSGRPGCTLPGRQGRLLLLLGSAGGPRLCPGQARHRGCGTPRRAPASPSRAVCRLRSR